MVAEAHLMVGIFFSFEQGNLNSFYQTPCAIYCIPSYTHIKETGPHHVATVCPVKDVVIVDGRVSIAIGIFRVPVGGLLWNQPVLVNTYSVLVFY